MRKGYGTLKNGLKLANWHCYILILAVFAIDCVLGNVYKVVGSTDYVKQVYQYVSFKEIFGIVPYLLLIVLSTGIKLRCDKFDMAILFTCLLLQLFNCVDFFVNHNWRPVWADWTIFFAVTIPATVLKVMMYRK